MLESVNIGNGTLYREVYLSGFLNKTVCAFRMEIHQVGLLCFPKKGALCKINF